MPKEKRPPSRGARWLVEQIAAGVQEPAGASDSLRTSRRLTRAEIDALVSKTLDEELERLDRGKPGR